MVGDQGSADTSTRSLLERLTAPRWWTWCICPTASWRRNLGWRTSSMFASYEESLPCSKGTGASRRTPVDTRADTRADTSKAARAASASCASRRWWEMHFEVLLQEKQALEASFRTVRRGEARRSLELGLRGAD